MKIITDTSKLRFSSLLKYGQMEIDDEYVVEGKGYDTLDERFILGMKPLGRIFFNPLENLNYTDGTPVETAHITGGEKGITDKYLKAGKRVYTEDMVLNIIQSRCYEVHDELKPKIPKDVHELISEIANNTAKNKGDRARSFLEKYKVEGFQLEDSE